MHDGWYDATGFDTEPTFVGKVALAAGLLAVSGGALVVCAAAAGAVWLRDRAARAEK